MRVRAGSMNEPAGSPMSTGYAKWPKALWRPRFGTSGRDVVEGGYYTNLSFDGIGDRAITDGCFGRSLDTPRPHSYTPLPFEIGATRIPEWAYVIERQSWLPRGSDHDERNRRGVQHWISAIRNDDCAVDISTIHSQCDEFLVPEHDGRDHVISCCRCHSDCCRQFTSPAHEYRQLKSE
jgi:hypothetical protein